jgi:predicted membrane GTPase involved in stress response
MMRWLRCECALLTLTQAMENAGAKILEPVMKVEVSGPEEYQGVLVASINRRKGVIQVRVSRRFMFLSDMWRVFLDSGHHERQGFRHRCLRSGTQQHVWLQHRFEKQHPGTSPAINHHFSRHNSRGSSALSNIESAAAYVTAP